MNELGEEEEDDSRRRKREEGDDDENEPLRHVTSSGQVDADL